VGAPPAFISSNFPAATTVSTGIGYVTFTINPNGGVLDMNSVTFNVNRDTKGPKDVFLRSSLDGFTANLASLTNLTPNSTAMPLTVINLSGPFDTITTPIEFRLYGVNASAAIGTFGVFNSPTQSAVVVTGGFSPVPEPAHIGLLCAACFGVWRWRMGIGSLAV
jgi:hypothetical protein